MNKAFDVHIGEVKIAKNGEQLKAILGSCVGIGVIWRERNFCGLAHCLLPEGPARNFNIGARFVDQAYRSLLALMKIRPDDYSKIEIVIAGGGNMTSSSEKSNADLVGYNNFKMAISEAESRGLRIIFKDGGGLEGRKIIINSSDCSYSIEKIPRISESA